MEDNKDLVVKQEDLAQVSGGSAGTQWRVCYFMPTGKRRTEGNWLLLRCGSSCHPLSGVCACHGQSHCVDKWHRVDHEEELDPQSFSNHLSKQKSNNYNSGGFGGPGHDPMPGPK